MTMFNLDHPPVADFLTLHVWRSLEDRSIASSLHFQRSIEHGVSFIQISSLQVFGELPIICFVDRAGDFDNQLDLVSNLRTQELRSAVGYAAFLISGDFLPINVSITDVVAAISAAVGTIRSYLCDTSMCHEGTPRYIEVNVRKGETGTSNVLVHFNFWIGCLDEYHSAVVCGREH